MSAARPEAVKAATVRKSLLRAEVKPQSFDALPVAQWANEPVFTSTAYAMGAGNATSQTYTASALLANVK